MTKEQKIAYVVHPVSAKLKQSLRENGMKIVDARFAPEDAKIINPHTKREKASPQQSQSSVDGIGTDSGEQFSDDQLRAAIEASTGRATHPQTKRETLIAKFNELNAQAAANE